MPTSLNKSAVTTLLLGTVILLIPTFYNGYPFVYSDTGAYIHSGFSNTVPGDRPILYGLFVRHISLAASLWLVVFVQSLILNVALYKLLILLLPQITNLNKYYLTIISLLTIFTAAPYNVGIIMPDMFTPVSFILLVILMFKKNLTPVKAFFYALFFLFFSMMHLSNLLSSVLIMIAALSIKIMFKPAIFNFKIKHGIFLLLLSLFSFILISLIHGIMGAPYKPSRHSHIFLTGKMVENGILKDYLNQNCTTFNYNICRYKDSLPNTCPQFVWDYNSPLYKLGGWDGNEEEYKAILSDIITSPKWFFRFAKESFAATLKQATLIAYGEEFIRYREESPPYMAVHWRYRDELNMYLSSKQNYEGYSNDFFNLKNTINMYLLCIALLILGLLFCSNTLNNTFSAVFLLSIVYLLANAASTGAISTFAARYTSRFNWIFIFMFFAALIAYRRELFKIVFNNTNE